MAPRLSPSTASPRTFRTRRLSPLRLSRQPSPSSRPSRSSSLWRLRPSSSSLRRRRPPPRTSSSSLSRAQTRPPPLTTSSSSRPFLSRPRPSRPRLKPPNRWRRPHRRASSTRSPPLPRPSRPMSRPAPMRLPRTGGAPYGAPTPATCRRRSHRRACPGHRPRRPSRPRPPSTPPEPLSPLRAMPIRWGTALLPPPSPGPWPRPRRRTSPSRPRASRRRPTAGQPGRAPLAVGASFPPPAPPGPRPCCWPGVASPGGPPSTSPRAPPSPASMSPA